MPGSGTPTDWGSGERVFGPPPGTLDVDWLVPALIEAVPGTSPEQARAALLAAWQQPASPSASGSGDALTMAARRVVDEAVEAYRA